MRILLLGATGQVGSRTAGELLRRSEIERLTLAGRNKDRLSDLNQRFRGRAGVVTARFDIRATDELTEHMRHHDMVVSCAGPGYELEEASVRAAVAAEVHYISLNDDTRAAASAAQIAAGSAARMLSGCGASPGLSNMLVALAMRELDVVDDVQIAIGASTRDAGGVAAELHFVTMLTEAATRGGSQPRSPHPVYFPEPVGWVETFACSHPEELAFRRHTERGASIAFYIGLVEKAVMDVIRASAAGRVTANETLKRAWLKAARPLQPLLERLGPGSGGWTAIRVDVHGSAGDRARTISLGVVDHLVNLASVALAEGAVRLAAATGTGVVTPEEIFEPESFLRAAAQRGVSFARLRPQAF